MRPVADLTRALRAMHATPRELALQIWTDELMVQRMTLVFEIKRAERRYVSHRALLNALYIEGFEKRGSL